MAVGGGQAGGAGEEEVGVGSVGFLWSLLSDCTLDILQYMHQPIFLRFCRYFKMIITI